MVFLLYASWGFVGFSEKDTRPKKSQPFSGKDMAHAHYALIPFVKELRLVGGRLREGGWRVGFMFRDLKIFSGRISSLC